MYNNTLMIDKLMKDGIETFEGLTQREYRLYRLDGSSDYNLLESIYQSMYLDKVFPDQEKLVETVLNYITGYGYPLVNLEMKVADELGIKYKEPMKKLNLVSEGGGEINLTKDILGKMSFQIQDLMSFIEMSTTCVLIFDQFRKGLVKPKDLDKRLTKYLKTHITVEKKNTNVTLVEKGSDAIVYIPEHIEAETEKEKLDYVKGLIYYELQNPSFGFLPYQTRTRLVGLLNSAGSLYSAEHEPFILLELELLRRTTGRDTIEELIYPILIGKVIDHEPNIMCYHGNLDKTITVHVKNYKADIESKFLPKILEEPGIKFYGAGGNIFITSDNYPKRTLLWTFLLGTGAEPYDGNYNNIVNNVR